jgi:phosphopentomutase
MPTINNVILVILDSVGIGELPDAGRYNDQGSNTLANIATAMGGLHLPHLEKLGLGCIAPILGVRADINPIGFYGKMNESSNAKDTTTGHWELAGIISEKPFMTFPDGFPAAITAKFEEIAGRGFLGNIAASGTVIINDLGDEHVRTGRPIIYTSADSVFQIAAHEAIIPLPELYRICHEMRLFLNDYNVGRVIARPFIGENGNYSRTKNRHDYSIPLPQPTVLDALKSQGIQVCGVGKIGDIFDQQGISKSLPAKGNPACIHDTIELMKQERRSFIFSNLVDFDMLYGHRNDTEGYARCLTEFDAALPEILAALQPNDLLLISADHGCDPTLKYSTDHTREYVPLLAYTKLQTQGGSLGIRQTFADVAATVAEAFGLAATLPGTSFFREVWPKNS